MTMERERIEAFKAEVAALCERHRIGMAGTCDNEGIYGEITLFDLDNPGNASWEEIEQQHLNWSD